MKVTADAFRHLKVPKKETFQKETVKKEKSEVGSLQSH